jgi:predicted lipid-binding transport protein (Tim44 family)
VQILELVIFAALAAVVLFQLYAVLGRRVGRQPEDAKPQLASRAPANAEEARRVDAENTEGLTGLALLRARDPSFEVSGFLGGARQAYEMIVTAYAAGDRTALRPLLADSVYEAFDGGIAAREAEGRTEKVEFLHPPRADLESIDAEGQTARVVVRFLAEFRSRSKGPEGEAVDDRRTAEVWTFERQIGSPDPNWLLTRVDAAEV